MLYFITGLSGAGKTTIGKALVAELNARGQNNVIFLDGDQIRWAFGEMFGYSNDDRKKLALSYPRICKLLTDQGFSVVFSTISMFNEVREWNRKTIENYLEIYLKVPLSILKERNQKGLYSTDTENLMGVSAEPELPQNPDIVIENDGRFSVEECVKIILERRNQCFAHLNL
jgi:adenylylsulfate kinase-like enzyme